MKLLVRQNAKLERSVSVSCWAACVPRIGQVLYIVTLSLRKAC
jgi:hypothetical protein